MEFTLRSDIAAFTKTNINALPCHVGKCEISLVLDRGAAINIIYEPSFRIAQSSFRGGRCRLLPNDINAVGITGYNPEILGKVSLTVQPSKQVSAFRNYFYIMKNWCYQWTPY